MQAEGTVNIALHTALPQELQVDADGTAWQLTSGNGRGLSSSSALAATTRACTAQDQWSVNKPIR